MSQEFSPFVVTLVPFLYMHMKIQGMYQKNFGCPPVPLSQAIFVFHREAGAQTCLTCQDIPSCVTVVIFDTCSTPKGGGDRGDS